MEQGAAAAANCECTYCMGSLDLCRSLYKCAGVTNYMVGALDPETADRLAEMGAPYFVLFDVAENGTALGLGPKDLAWGSPAFHSMGRIKINLLNTFLGYDLDVLLCDTDTVWMKDPTPYFVQYPTADILITTDHMFPTVEYGDTGLELPDAAHSAMNIGVMFFRSNAAVADFVEQWVKSLDADPNAWDQVRALSAMSECKHSSTTSLYVHALKQKRTCIMVATCVLHRLRSRDVSTLQDVVSRVDCLFLLQHIFNVIVRQGFHPGNTHESHERLFLGFNGRLAVGVLPVSAFASGHTFHVQHLHKVCSLFLLYLQALLSVQCDRLCKPLHTIQQQGPVVAGTSTV